MSTVVTTLLDDAAVDSGYQHTSLVNESQLRSNRMRRVASAPAFKHASAYQAPSAAAAVALAQADADAEAGTTTDQAASNRSTSSARRSAKLSSKLLSWRAAPLNGTIDASRTATCSSCSGGRCRCLEVYVVSRPFTEFGGDLVKSLPPEAKDGMVDLGLCHYMTVFRTPDGQLVQFDFGPMGGDVQKAHGPLATFLRRAHAAALAQAHQAHTHLQFAPAAAPAPAADASSTGRGMVHSPSAPLLPLASVDLAGDAGEAATAALTGRPARQPRQKGVAGEIRERQLDGLPAASMYMGRTQLSLADIRQYNQLQGNMRYTLHDNDCRHYVNSLVQYATGVERSTQHLKRHYFQTRNADKWLWYGWLVSATQLVTDVGNWSHVQAGAAVTLLAVTGRSTLAQLKTLTLPIIPAITRSMPVFIPSTGAAAAAGGAASATGGLATTLKLPAALLLKRPLAGSAVAAAGGAGAAAAAIRTVPVGPDGAATAAAAASSSSGASGGRTGVFRLWGRSVKQWGDGLGQGLRGAVLTVRRFAVGHRAMVVEQLESAAAAQATATRGTAGRRGWFGRRDSNLSDSRQLAQVGAATAVIALPSPAAVAVGSSAQTGRADINRVELCGGSGSNNRQELKLSGLMGGLGHHVGRHVLWLGSSASKATGAIAVLASKQMSYFANRHAAGQAAAAAALEGSQYSLAHSSSSGNLLCQQQPCPAQQQHVRMTLGQRSKSAPSLALVAAAAAAAATPGGPEWNAHIHSAAGAMQVELMQPEFCMSDDLYGSSGPGSVISSSVGGRASGVGRQVLNLPAPRLSWGRRASHAVIVGK